MLSISVFYRFPPFYLHLYILMLYSLLCSIFLIPVVILLILLPFLFSLLAHWYPVRFQKRSFLSIGKMHTGSWKKEYALLRSSQNRSKLIVCVFPFVHISLVM